MAEDVRGDDTAADGISAENEKEKPSDKKVKKRPKDEGIVITASRLPEDVRLATQKITIIGDDKIAGTPSPNENISDLIRYQPGVAANVYARTTPNYGSYGGMGPNYNIYLLDGLGIDAFIDLMTLDSAAVERIEVFKGPGSVLYSNYMDQYMGAQSAFAGVTNVVLRDRITAPMTRFSFSGGSYDTRTYRVYHQSSSGGFNYFFGGMNEQSRYTDFTTGDPRTTMIDNPQYEKNRLYGRVGYLFSSRHHLSLFAIHGQMNGNNGRPNIDYLYNTDLANLDYYNAVSDNITIQAKAGYRHINLLDGFDNYIISGGDMNLAWRAEVIQDIAPSDLSLGITHLGESLLTIGVDNQYAAYRTYIEMPLKIKQNDMIANNTGTYIQERLVLDRLILRAGGRFNCTRHNYDMIEGRKPADIPDTRSWKSLVWSAGARLNLPDRYTIFVNGGNSFIVPMAFSIMGNLNRTDAGVPGKNGFLPNPGLSPESGNSFDAGLEKNFYDFLHISARGFYARVHDVIIDRLLRYDPVQYQSINAGTMTVSGGEFETRITLLSGVDIFGNYTVQRNNIKNPYDDDADNVRAVAVPENLANFGVSADMPMDFSAAIYGHYSGPFYDSLSRSQRRELPSYFVMNARVQKALTVESASAVNVSVDLINITNKKYKMNNLLRDPGFAFNARVELVL